MVEIFTLLTNFRVTKVHNSKSVKLPSLTHNAEVKHDSVEFTVWRSVFP